MTPSRLSAAFCSASRRPGIKSSVKSGAAAMPSSPATRPGRSSAASSMIQPPMLEPTSTCGPSATASSTATASSAQRPMVPSVKAPLDSPWPR